MHVENPLAGVFHLVVEKGPDQGQVLALPGKCTHWGRPPLSDRGLSRNQLAWQPIRRRGHLYWQVANLNPQVPVQVRRRFWIWRTIQGTQLIKVGSRLRIGQTVLRVCRRPLRLQAPILKPPSKFRWTLLFSIPMFIFLPISLSHILHLSPSFWWGLGIIILLGFLIYLYRRYISQLDPVQALLLTSALIYQVGSSNLLNAPVSSTSAGVSGSVVNSAPEQSASIPGRDPVQHSSHRSSDDSNTRKDAHSPEHGQPARPTEGRTSTRNAGSGGDPKFLFGRGPHTVGDLPRFGASLGAWKRIWTQPGEHICFLGPRAKTIARWWTLQCLLSHYRKLSFRLNHLQLGNGDWELCLLDFPVENKNGDGIDIWRNDLCRSESANRAADLWDETSLARSIAKEHQILVSWATSIHLVPPGATRVIKTGSRYYPTEKWWDQIVALLSVKALTQAEAPTAFPSRSLKSSLCHLLPSLNRRGAVSTKSTELQMSAPITPIRAIYQTWQKSGDSLEVPIGYGESELVTLDLAKQGPHALLAGTTGSGKSVALLTWLLAMAFRYSPKRLLFVLVDYKGGEAFRQLEGLPHVCGVLTDLEPAMTLRAIKSLQAEIRYREQYKTVGKIEDLPKIVVAVDEFAVLKSDHPQVMEALIRLATLGRSLGIHLILATQRPGGVVDAQIKSNLPLRICLRVLESSDSMDILGDSRAINLPGQPGRAWIQTPVKDQLEQVQFLWSGNDRFISTAVSWIKRTWRLESGSRLRRPWADPLPEKIFLAELPGINPKSSQACIGLADFPEEQKTAPFQLKFPTQAQIVAAPQSGKTTLLQILAQTTNQLGKTVHFVGLSNGETEETGSGSPPAILGGWVNGTIALQPQMIRETMQRFITGNLSGTLLIDGAEQIIEELDRLYGPLSTSELLTSLLQHARGHRQSIFLTCQPGLATARFAQGFPIQIVGAVRDPIQAAQIGLSKTQREQLNQPGLFIYQPSGPATLFKAALSTPGVGSPVRAGLAPQPNPGHQLIPSALRSPTIPRSQTVQGSLVKRSPMSSTFQPNPAIKRLFPLPNQYLVDDPAILGTGFDGPIFVPDDHRSWLVIGPGGSGRSAICKLLKAQNPNRELLDDLEDDPGKLENWFAHRERKPLIVACYPTTLQNGYTAAFSYLKNQAYYALLGDAKLCRQFTGRYQSQALPDHHGLLPGRGMFINRKQALAIQFSHYRPTFTPKQEDHQHLT